jgi:hypothetical protein
MIIRHFTDIDWMGTFEVTCLMLIGTCLAAGALSLRWGGWAVDLTTRKSVPRLRPEFSTSFFLLLWPFLFVVTASVSLVANAAAQDKDGLYGQTGAAWMQAGGSVIAIVAVILVDQLASRRLRQERRENELSVSARRVAAIREAAIALEKAETEVRSWNLAPNQATQLSTLAIQRINGALAALVYLHQQGAELEIEVLAALCLSIETYQRDSGNLLSAGLVLGSAHARIRADQFKAAAERQRSIFEDVSSYLDRKVRNN